MKIAVPCSEPNLDSKVGRRLGTAAYLLIVETDDMSFEVLDGPPPSSAPGAGVQVISLVVDRGARAILVGYASPHIIKAMRRQGIKVMTDVSGVVRDAVSEFMQSRLKGTTAVSDGEPAGEWVEAIGKGLKQFLNMVPRMVGVVLLLGLFRGFVSDETLLSLFSGSPLYDSFLGTSLGSVMAGSPVNSYIIGKNLLHTGVGVAGVTALMLAWVNIGVIILPAESAALGFRFTLVRNVASFVMVVLMSFVMALLIGWLA
ncbi:NifB/NifX family molybdenum-iron cluster-binding protein [Pseudodesulfovibrio sediminis]|uniref:Dinitrogenase iron-molybdenum cofactor biosynthesis domain-containing protein n=1 Tax=Pseudodesulfovibrio sediminis TaxID=2810563 RepID=A0ABN6ENJ0_9BACT|nr:NifB/NifX family molybdenum-iron cluster-binding protein [Pseudodesulfovibrio sediminis]BCS87781.1 hypothetical protein PSDVSF_10230 [Pseudodesulfovibrio sediminis]